MDDANKSKGRSKGQSSDNTMNLTLFNPLRDTIYTITYDWSKRLTQNRKHEKTRSTEWILYRAQKDVDAASVLRIINRKFYCFVWAMDTMGGLSFDD